MSYGWPTTRRFPRTINDAFQDSVENAQWWYPPERSASDMTLRWLSVALWICLGLYLWRI